MSAPRLSSCPVCGGRKLRAVRHGRYVTRRSGKPIVVPHVDYLECLACGERYFDDATFTRIEQARTRSRRKTAV